MARSNVPLTHRRWVEVRPSAPGQPIRIGTLLSPDWLRCLADRDVWSPAHHNFATHLGRSTAGVTRAFHRWHQWCEYLHWCLPVILTRQPCAERSNTDRSHGCRTRRILQPRFSSTSLKSPNLQRSRNP